MEKHLACLLDIFFLACICSAQDFLSTPLYCRLCSQPKGLKAEKSVSEPLMCIRQLIPLLFRPNQPFADKVRQTGRTLFFLFCIFTKNFNDFVVSSLLVYIHSKKLQFVCVCMYLYHGQLKASLSLISE